MSKVLINLPPGMSLRYYLQLKRLHTLADDFNGILWLPNQHNYTLTADTAVTESGDPVGYIGSHRQNLPENLIKDSMISGGTESAVAPTWSVVTNSGITTAIVGKGFDSQGYPCQFVRFSGTASANAFPAIQMLSSANAYSTTYLKMLSGSAVFKLAAGSFSGVASCNFRACRGLKTDNAGSGDVTNTANMSALGLGSTETKYTGTVVLADALTVKVRQEVVVSVTAGNTVDFTLQISQPQLERGKPTAFTPTYGEAITRGVNFEPAWQDTTANKPLLGVDADGKAILTFDGSNDFFRTGIQTPEEGYAAGAWQTSSTGSLRDFFSASNTASVAGAVFRKNATEQTVLQRNDGTATTATTITSPAFGTTKRIIDGHWSASGAAIRLDGANEATSALARTATSTNYFRIGAAGSGGDNQANYWHGNMNAQLYIPGARPGATVEAQIRRLLAEITAVSGVV